MWKDIWGATQDATQKWPNKVKVFRDRMYREEKLSVFIDFHKSVIVEHHHFLVPFGLERTLDHMNVRYIWADRSLSKQNAKYVTRNCQVCQACMRIRDAKWIIGFIPLPPKTMHN